MGKQRPATTSVGPPTELRTPHPKSKMSLAQTPSRGAREGKVDDQNYFNDHDDDYDNDDGYSPPLSPSERPLTGFTGLGLGTRGYEMQDPRQPQTRAIHRTPLRRDPHLLGSKRSESPHLELAVVSPACPEPSAVHHESYRAHPQLLGEQGSVSLGSPPCHTILSDANFLNLDVIVHSLTSKRPQTNLETLTTAAHLLRERFSPHNHQGDSEPPLTEEDGFAHLFCAVRDSVSQELYNKRDLLAKAAQLLGQPSQISTPVVQDLEQSLWEQFSRAVTGGGKDIHCFGTLPLIFPSRCLEGTRKRLLSDITSYLSRREQPVVWLSGSPASGKSAVAGTVAEILKREGCLGGASFFNLRDENHECITSLVLTLAYHLANSDPIMKKYALTAIHEHPSVLTEACSHQDQLEILLLRPLRARVSGATDAVFVMDGLDARGNPELFKLISFLADALRRIDFHKVRIFITSRFDTGVSMDVMSDGIRSICIQDYDATDDIKFYIRHSFQKALESPQLPGSFPIIVPVKEQDIVAIAKQSTDFLIITTILSFIVGARDPASALQIVLNSVKTSNQWSTEFDNLFLHVLRSSCDWRRAHRVIPIMYLAEPLTTTHIRHLLSIDSSDSVLEDFTSIIHIPRESNQPPVIRYPLLRDFLEDPSRSREYHFDPAGAHLRLAHCCFEIMDDMLRRDICQLADPSKLHSEIGEFIERRETAIPPPLRYACLHWAMHLRKSDTLWDNELELTFISFLAHHILHWIEVLCLLGELRVAVNILHEAERCLSHVLLERRENAKLMLHGTRRFVLEFFDAISVSALHIYHSALPFLPKDSCLRKAYSADLSHSKVAVTFGLPATWDGWIYSIDAKRQIRSFAISNDGLRMSLVARDFTLQVWDITTRLLLNTHIPSALAYSCAFSPDGSQIAYAFRHAVVLRHITTDDVIIIIGEGEKRCIRFSRSGSQVATCAISNTLRCSGSTYTVYLGSQETKRLSMLWTSHIDDLSRVLCCDIAFSLGDTHLAVAVDHVIDLVDIHARCCVRRLTADSGSSTLLSTTFARIFYTSFSQLDCLVYFEKQADGEIHIFAKVVSSSAGIPSDHGTAREPMLYWDPVTYSWVATDRPADTQTMPDDVEHIMLGRCLAAVKIGNVLLPAHGGSEIIMPGDSTSAVQLAACSDSRIVFGEWQPERTKEPSPSLADTQPWADDSNNFQLLLPPQSPAFGGPFFAFTHDEPGYGVNSICIVHCSGRQQTISTKTEEGSPCDELAFSPDSSMIACVYRAPFQIRLVDAASGTITTTLRRSSDFISADETPVLLDANTRVAFTHDNSMLAYADHWNGVVQVWAISTGQLLAEWVSGCPINPEFSLDQTHITWLEDADWSPVRRSCAIGKSTTPHDQIRVECDPQVAHDEDMISGHAFVDQPPIYESVNLRDTSPDSEMSAQSPSILCHAGELGYPGISERPSPVYNFDENGWIFKNGQRLCWLPHRYRRKDDRSNHQHPSYLSTREPGQPMFFVCGNGIAIHQTSGVLLVQLPNA